MYGSSNSKRSALSVPKNISSSSTHVDLHQDEQSNVQKEEQNSARLEKLDGQVSQTGVSSFDRTENVLTKEDDCSTSCSDVDDDDDTYDEYDEQELLVEFKKLISKHMNYKRDMGISYVLIKDLLTHMHSRISSCGYGNKCKRF
jgi:hypothetical protein